jgi:hypothetical protein
MKIFRKLQRQVEIKIQHAMATGKLPWIERNSAAESGSKTGLEKAEGGGIRPPK